MPVFNAGATLRRAVDSVRGQSLADWELVIVDDGSDDDTPAILEALQKEEPRLRVLRRPHQGLVAALNAGLAAAQAPLIARMDADDESHPDRLMEQVQCLEEHPAWGLVSCRVGFGGCITRAIGYALHVDWINSLLTPEEIALNRFVESPLAHPSVVFRACLPERHGAYREGPFPEDYELWLRWLEAGVMMGKVPRELLTWHDPPSRLSRNHPRYDPEAFYQCKTPFLVRWLRERVEPSRRILVWGAGRPTRKRAGLLTTEGIPIQGYIDIDPRKQGRRLAGRAVLAPYDIPGPAEVFVLGYVARRGARELARAHLGGRGFVEGRDFLMVA
jgi:glycosyltransferase involved in cell wall biosynthesis